jgi:hypothetical protein
MDTFRQITAYLAKVAKAVASGVAAGLAYLLGVWGESTTVDQAFDLTAQQYGLLVLSVLGAWGIGRAATKS